MNDATTINNVYVRKDEQEKKNVSMFNMFEHTLNDYILEMHIYTLNA